MTPSKWIVYIALLSISLPGTAPRCEEVGARLTLTDVVSRALETHPALREVSAGRAVADAEREQLSRRTPWQLNLELENFAGTGELSGLGSTETTVAIGRRIERGNKPALRRAVGNAAVALAERELEATRLNVAAAAAESFISALAAQERVRINDRYRALTESARDSILRRVRLGASAEADLATAEITVARADAELRQSRHQLRKRRHLIETVTGADAQKAELVGDLFQRQSLGSLAQLQGKLNRNPGIARFDQLAQTRRAEQRLAAARGQADLTMGAGIRHLARPGDTAFVVTMEVPLGQRSQAQPGIRLAQAREQAVPAAQANARLRLEIELLALHADLVATEEELEILSERILPLAEQAVALYQSGFDRGRYALFELYSARRELLQARRDRVSAAERYRLIALRLQNLTGELPNSGDPS